MKSWLGVAITFNLCINITGPEDILTTTTKGVLNFLCYGASWKATDRFSEKYT